jgi:hypothetical protein
VQSNLITNNGSSKRIGALLLASNVTLESSIYSNDFNLFIKSFTEYVYILLKLSIAKKSTKYEKRKNLEHSFLNYDLFSYVILSGNYNVSYAISLVLNTFVPVSLGALPPNASSFYGT